MRLCPICNDVSHELIYRYTTTFAGEQEIYACYCGMIYASSSAVDYTHSQYARPGGTGSGEGDKARLESTASLIAKMVSKDASILDFGCAQGGLLDALREKGYANLCGFDLSPQCMEIVKQKGYRSLKFEQFDLIILSHVLEHIEHIHAVLINVLDHLKPSGQVYIEVPDAQRYAIPFLDFNSEHINHFDACSLKKALEQVGLFGGMVQERTIQLANGADYPVLWTLASRSRTVIRMYEFVKQSQAKLAKLMLEDAVILWGAGEYLAHILPLVKVPIAQIIDSNMIGIIDGFKVQKPDEIYSDLPILITALVAAPAIKKQIAAMGLKNRVIEMRFE